MRSQEQKNYREKLKEYRENLTPEQKALHAEEARLEMAWKKTENPKKKKVIKIAHSAIVERLIALCNFDRRGVNGVNSRGIKKKEAQTSNKQLTKKEDVVN